MSCEGSSESPGVSSRIQDVSLDVANLVVCLWMSPAGLQVSLAESRRYHWMLRMSWYISGYLQQVSRCLQRNSGGMIGCREHRGMSCEGSSESPGVSSGIWEESWDVTNLVVCLWMSPAGLQVSLAESRRDHWMSRTSWYVAGHLQRVSRHLQQNPGEIIGCRECHGMSPDISSRSPGFSSAIQEGSLDVVNVDICLVKAPVSLQVSPAECRRDHWMSQTSWYVSGHLQQVSRCLQQNPGGIIGCCEHHCMSLDISSRSPGVSSGIQAVSFDVANIDGCLAKAPASLQVSPAESRRYHWM